MQRLLVVEDDPNTLDGMVELLSDEGYQVQGVMNGNDALEVIANEPMDIVLCDFDLPDMNGLKVSMQMKQLQPSVNIFMVTAYYDSQLLDAADKCGIEKVFRKPLSIDDMLETLSRSKKQKVFMNSMSYFI